MLCNLVPVPRKKKTGSYPVYLNVYDLTPINGYAYWFGLGVYHSGVQVCFFKNADVQYHSVWYFLLWWLWLLEDRFSDFNCFCDIVHGVEYGFGAHDRATTGIFEVEPKNCPGFTFRKSITIGSTDLSPKDVRAFMENLAEQYPGNSYNLIQKNCNHFCNDVCIKLTGRSIPRWVNRLARLGFLCNCVLPPCLNETKVRQITLDRVQEGEKKKMRSQSSRYEASPNHPLSSSQRHCLPPSSSVISASSSSTLTVK